ncbi:serine hydrolase domain-containing protein [Nonomuraea sp. NPDC050556]|uniref:serine hydrolase domain-containing protein n=1 Tax=Nonomuraea sp. NPDC050556 TaxID=3364369 RepID=UPI0037A4851F
MTTLQKNVQAAIDELVGSGAERGVQVAVCRNGELLVDAVAGVADPATGRAMTSDTPVYVTSTGKGVIATVAHVLAERGALAYDAPIVEYWPEFGAHGKDKATVRQALSFSVGVPGVPVDSTPENLADWDGMCATIAAAKPWWEPGTQIGYHPQTFMFIVGEIVRRASGKRISQVLLDEVAGPLGLADELYLAVPEAELPRLAVIEDSGPAMELPPEMLESMPFFRVVDGFTAAPLRALPDAAYSNRADILTSDSGASMSARAIARTYDALQNGLISPERLAEVTSVAASGDDVVSGMPAAYGLGFALRLLDRETTFGWFGSGGTAGFADLATGTSVGITKNVAAAGEFSTVQHIASIVL